MKKYLKKFQSEILCAGAFLLAFAFTPVLGFAKTYEIKSYNSYDGQSMVFAPTLLNVQVGDEIKFIPEDKGHNTKSLLLPEGAKPWESDYGVEFTLKLEKEGVYIYECQSHGLMGMSGIIQVGKAVNQKEAKAFYGDYKKKLVMNKNRLDSFFEK